MNPLAFIPIIGHILDKVLPRVLPDKDAQERAKNEIKAALLEADTQTQLAQLAVNKQEAGHRSIFVAGWRPFIGWSCGVILLYVTFLRDLLQWGIALTNPELPPLPNPDLTALWPVLFGMLGLGGYRTYEKQQGVAK